MAIPQPLSTKFTRLLGIKTPICSAPMYGVASTSLVAAISSGGGLGFLPAGWGDAEQLIDQLDTVRKLLAVPEGAPIPIGVGFLAFLLDANGGVDDSRIPAALAAKPLAVLFAFGKSLGKYVDKVREIESTSEHKTKIFITVNSVADAQRATNEFGVDGLIVQGSEAGGHSGDYATPLLTVLQAVLNAISRENSPVIIAAGGVSTGPQIAALLTLGADGVLLGTRFLATPESLYSDDKKQVILESDFNATAKNRIFDQTNRTEIWPDNIDGRAIANDILTDYNAGDSLETRLKKHDEGLAKNEKNRLVVWAGVGVGHIKEIEPASVILQELHEGALQRLRTAAIELGVGGA